MKLPHIGSYSNSTKKKIYELCKTFCKNTNIKIVCSPFKLQDLFCSRDCLPVALKSFVVYKFTGAGCQSCSMGKPNAIYQQRSRNICKLIQNLIFLKTWMRILTAEFMLWQLLHNNWSCFIFFQIKTERGAPYNLVKTRTKQKNHIHSFLQSWNPQALDFKSLIFKKSLNCSYVLLLGIVSIIIQWTSVNFVSKKIKVWYLSWICIF